MIWKTFKWDYLKKSPDTSGKNPIKRAITEVLKKQIEISRNPMIYNNPEFEKPMKMVDFCRSRDAKVFKALKVNLPNQINPVTLL